MTKSTSRLFLVLALVSLPLFAQSPSEQSLLQLANQARAAHSLPPLHWDNDLARAARAHVPYLVHDPSQLLHQYPGEPDLTTRAHQAGAHFSTVAENLAGRGESPAAIQQIWMTTPTHRANLLDPNLSAAGIAIVEANGLLYAVEDFSHSVSSLNPEAVEQQVAKLLQDQGIPPAASNEDARKTCTMSQGNAGTPKLVIQWDTPDLTQLPPAIVQQLHSGNYTSGAAGACPGRQPNNQQFTTWHIALLLY
jgi:hypothetical protein